MDWLNDNAWLGWLGLAIALAAIEVATVDFVFVMLAGGALAGSLGLDAGRTALLLAYDDVQTVTAAALKLLPLDPLAALDWSLGVREEIARLVADLADLTDPDDIPADSAPALEAWHHVHSLADRRLFRA